MIIYTYKCVQLSLVLSETSLDELSKSCVIWLSSVSKSLGFASWRKHLGDGCMASAHAQAFLSTCPKPPHKQFLAGKPQFGQFKLRKCRVRPSQTPSPA